MRNEGMHIFFFLLFCLGKDESTRGQNDELREKIAADCRRTLTLFILSPFGKSRQAVTTHSPAPSTLHIFHFLFSIFHLPVSVMVFMFTLHFVWPLPARGRHKRTKWLTLLKSKYSIAVYNKEQENGE